MIEVACNDPFDRRFVQSTIEQRLRERTNTNTNLLILLSLLMILIRRDGAVLRHWSAIHEAQN